MSIRIIGNYQILDEFEHGALGPLYRGRHVGHNTEVVVREINLARFPVSTRVQLKSRFRRELFVHGQLNHPAIARVYQSFVKGDNYYIVSEYVPGMSLRDLLIRQGLPTAPQALYICKQALTALDYAHTAVCLDESDVRRTGVIHRDIKPSNLVIDGQGRLKITDFGIVRMPDRQSLAPPSFQPGTPEYMPPEQLRGLELDVRADIYSLGVTFYQVLTGHLPYSRASRDADSDQLRIQAIDQDPPLISDIRSDVDPSLASIFARAIARNPGSRFQTAAEFLHAIRQFERLHNQVESPSKPFSARQSAPLKQSSGAQRTAQQGDGPHSKPSQAVTQGRTTLPVPATGQHVEPQKRDSGGLDGRRVTSPLPRPSEGRRGRESGRLEKLSTADQDQFFIGETGSRSRAGWVVAAALIAVAVFAGFYLFLNRGSEPPIQTPTANISSASAAVDEPTLEQPPPATPNADAVAYLQQARDADREGKFNTAINLYDAYLRIAPDSADTASVADQADKLRKFVAHLNAARWAFNRQDYKTARDSYSEALKLRPYSRLVQTGIAECDARMAQDSPPDVSTRPRRASAPPTAN